jgi:hypothetical protein
MEQDAVETLVLMSSPGNNSQSQRHHHHQFHSLNGSAKQPNRSGLSQSSSQVSNGFHGRHSRNTSIDENALKLKEQKLDQILDAMTEKMASDDDDESDDENDREFFSPSQQRQNGSVAALTSAI